MRPRRSRRKRNQISDEEEEAEPQDESAVPSPPKRGKENPNLGISPSFPSAVEGNQSEDNHVGDVKTLLKRFWLIAQTHRTENSFFQKF